jgi:hypothetical protein
VAEKGLRIGGKEGLKGKRTLTYGLVEVLMRLSIVHEVDYTKEEVSGTDAGMGQMTYNLENEIGRTLISANERR